jgi:hypothetical protein
MPEPASIDTKLFYWIHVKESPNIRKCKLKSDEKGDCVR